MPGNSFGTALRVTTFGESHGVALGCVVDGCPAGLKLKEEEVQLELDRRRPGQSAVATARQEGDRVEILSGVFEGRTTGSPIALLIRNENQRSADYSKLKDVFRPGHADFTWLAKFGLRDYRGGGRSSGRETVARVAAGVIAQKILDQKKIRVMAHATQIGTIKAEKFAANAIEKNSVRCADSSAAKAMETAIIAAKEAGDSLGGIVEVKISNAPAGLGEPVFDKVEALLGHALLSIGAVKGIEFGAGFALAGLRGSQANDSFVAVKNKISKSSNRAGGILGGITDGDEIVCRLAVKPTASIALAQNTIDIAGHTQKIQIGGRHDPCIVPRLVPVAESMARLVLADLLLRSRGDRV